MAAKAASPAEPPASEPDPSAADVSKASDPQAEDEDVVHAELSLFACREAYVYRIPPASTIGHRAELWDVDHWLQEVSLSVVSQQDDCWVRLFDKASGELFAECPIPQNQPLVTVVEPVMDSSRYFVLRIEDRDSRRHAFIGIGFRERNQASDFSAALDDHLQYLRRKREADRMRQQYQAAAAAAEAGQDADGVAAAAAAFGPARDLALKPGETIKVALPNKNQDTGPTSMPAARLSSLAAKSRLKGVSPTPVKMGSFSATSAATSPSSDGASPPAPLLPPPPRASPASSASSVHTPTPSEQAAAAGTPGGDSDAFFTPHSAATPDSATEGSFRGRDYRTPQAASAQEGEAEEVDVAEAGSRSLARSSFDGSTMAPSSAAASDPRRARFSLFDDGEAEPGTVHAIGECLAHFGGAGMRVSLPRDIDESDAASLAGLSLKAHTSGGSSLAGSAFSETGEDEASEEGGGTDSMAQRASGKQDDWGEFVS